MVKTDQIAGALRQRELRSCMVAWCCVGELAVLFSVNCSRLHLKTGQTTTDARAENRKAYAYWSSISGDRQMPTRSSLSPRAMREFLTYVNLVDIHPSSSSAVEYEIALQ